MDTVPLSIDNLHIDPTLDTVPLSIDTRSQVPADSTLHPTERKRILHLHAEQSRRMALKDGFDQLMEIVSSRRREGGGVKRGTTEWKGGDSELMMN